MTPFEMSGAMHGIENERSTLRADMVTLGKVYVGQ